MTNTFTELEIIEVLQNKGIEVKQNQTTYYQQKGIIQSGKSLKAFCKTIEQVFESVTVEGRGKKRIYTVGAELETIKEREDGRINNGKSLSPEQEEFFNNAMAIILQENYIDKPMTLSTWANVLGAELIPTSQYDIKVQELINKLTDTFKLKHTNDMATKDELQNKFPRFRWFRSIDITKNFIERYNVRAKNITSNVFKIGTEKGYFETVTTFSGAVEDKYITITQEVYNDFKQAQKDLLARHGLTMNQWLSKSIEYKNFIKKDAELLQEEKWVHFETSYKAITTELIKRFGVEMVFESIIITNVSEQAQKDFKYGEKHIGKEILTDYMISDMEKRYYNLLEKDLLQESDFKKRFAYLVATVMLDKIDTKVMAQFEEHLPQFIENFERFLISYEVENNGLFITTEQIEERVETNKKFAINTIKVYKLNNNVHEKSEEEEYIETRIAEVNLEYSNEFYDSLPLFLQQEVTEVWHNGSYETRRATIEKVNKYVEESQGKSQKVLALLQKEKEESYLIGDYLEDRRKQDEKDNILFELFNDVQK